MDRRSLIKKTGIAGVLAAGIAPAVHAQATVRWRLASSFPKSLDTIYGSADVFSKAVKEMSGGKFEVSVHAALGIRSAMVAHRSAIKRWDLIALATERRDLLNFDPATSAPWPILDTPGQEVQPIALNLNAEVRADMRWTHWVQAFMDVHETLTRKVRMTAGVAA